MSERGVTAVRGGMTAAECWACAIDDLCRAGDHMEEPEERRLRARTGVAWARVAYLMERVHERPEEAVRHDWIDNLTERCVDALTPSREEMLNETRDAPDSTETPR